MSDSKSQCRASNEDQPHNSSNDLLNITPLVTEILYDLFIKLSLKVWVCWENKNSNSLRNSHINFT